MDYPEYIKINEKEYKINTDFRVAIECNRIAEDNNIGDYERALAIIYLLFGDEALEDFENHNKILELGLKFLSCGKKVEKSNKKPDMDYIEDIDYIEASFMSDYHIDLSQIKMHWWKFNKLINGLSNSEFGNCCILNNIRNLRNYDISQIKDRKERQKIIEAQKQVELKKYKKKTAEQKRSSDEFFKKIGIDRS